MYASKEPTEVSWFQPVPARSLRLIRATGIGEADPILDTGGGASTLVDNLVAAGFSDISVLDISAAALERSRARLLDKADDVTWIVSDVTDFVPERHYALWHDRAVFHFLTEPADRTRYREVVLRALRDDGHLVLSTFGPQGPLRCSGLDIRRYDVAELQELFGRHFDLREYEIEDHQTPGGATQQFLYTWWQRL